MAQTPLKILFLCTGNSARSILAEFLLERLAPTRFDVYSAGAAPTGKVNPLAIKVLAERYHVDATSARSKSWDEFREVKFDFVVTVCDKARESCPVWPGQPVIAHWGTADPAAVAGTPRQQERAFVNVAVELNRRLELLCALPLEKLERLRLEKAVREMSEGATDSPGA